MALSIQTDRLSLRVLEEQDASFILELLTDPDWLKYIGDRGVHNLEDARRYIDEGPRAMYRNKGYCLLRVALKENDQPIGLCGLLKRDNLPHPDLGFAFLPVGRGAGYAREAANAVLANADEQGLETLMAFCVPDNQPSIRLLEKAGFYYAGPYQFAEGEDSLSLYRRDCPMHAAS